MPDKNLTYAQRYYQSALDFFDQGQYSKALEHINKAIEKSPQSADYFSTKGIFLHKMNDLAQAIEAYRRALELNPGHTFSHFNLGLIFMKLGKTIEAIQEWEAVIKVNPTDVNAIFNIAVSLGQIGRRREAIQFYERVLQIQPNHVQTHQNLGILYRDEKQYEKAKSHLNKLKHLDSTYSEVVTIEIGKCNEMEFLEKSSLLDAAKIAHELTARHPEGPQLGDALSACIDGSFSDALKIVDSILHQNPADSGARILRGQCLASLSRNDEAIVEFMGILAENPTIAEVHFQLGNIFLNMGESEKALEHFERVKRLDPSYPVIDENIFNLKQLVAKK